MPYRRANVRIELAGGEFWVEVKPAALADSEEVLKLSQKPGQEWIYGRKMLLQQLVAWNVTDDDDLVKPITEETVRELYDDDVVAILKAISDLRKPRTQEEQVVFTPPSTRGHVGEELYPAGLNGLESSFSLPAS